MDYKKIWKSIKKSYTMTKATSFVLRHLSFCLYTGIIILIWYLIIALSYNPYEIRLAKKHTKAKEARKGVPGSLQFSLQPFSYYSNILKSRELFGVNKKAEEIATDSLQLQVPPPVTIGELVAKFSLVGLVSVNGKYEAVIQNKQTGQIRYLQEGDSVEELIIKRIASGKVIFQYKNEEMELGL